jgi:molecular chaperone DnaK (HSP70)
MAMGVPDTRVCEEDSFLQIVGVPAQPLRMKEESNEDRRKLDEPNVANKDGETPEQLAKIYLSCLHTHFISVLEKRLSPSVVRSTPMDFVVTVPAIWTTAAKEATERAAAVAGFCGKQRIQLISEPVRLSDPTVHNIADTKKEAAALYTLKNLSPSALQLGRRFVVCDAGGGTVDLITYEVTKVDNLELKEVTEGTGGKCGSSMLNKRFRRHLKQTHGEKYWTDERLVQALNEFETVSQE